MSNNISATIDIDTNREHFLKWTVEKYHTEVDWDELYEDFERTATLVRSLVEACVDAGTLGSTEFMAICHAANLRLTKPKLQEYIRSFELDETMTATLVESVPESFGVVGGPTMSVSVETTEAEETLLAAFGTLLDQSASHEELLTAVDKIAAAETEGAKSGRITPVLSLLWPEVFPINNGRTRTVLTEFFGLSVNGSLENYRDEIPMYTAVRDQFGFRNHFRDLDRYCSWALKGDGADVSTWLAENEIEDRTVWQINAGVSDRGEPDKLWPLWKEHGICSIGWDAIDLSTLTDDEIEEHASQWDSGSVADYYTRFSRKIKPGQIVIAKSGYSILGIGVTTQGGYQFCDDFIETETGVHHPHVWPVEWVVTLDSAQNTSDWDLSPNLQSRTTLMRTRAFEQIRLLLSRKQPSLQSELATLEKLVAEPPVGSLPDSCKTEWTPSNEYDYERSFYWVNQTYGEELTGEYLRSTDTKWQRDLTVLEPGDVVFHYSNQSLQAWSIVVTASYRDEHDGTQHYFVDVDTERLEDPIPLSEVVGVLSQPDIKQGQSRYPIDKNGGVIQAYLCHLSPAAAEYLIDVTDANIHNQSFETQYFWINASKAHWDQKGDIEFYSTKNSDGNKWQNQDAFERARPGDKVLVYQLSPEKQIIGRAQIAKGLHEKDAEDGETSSTGITIEWVESIDGPSWKRVASDPELTECRVVEGNNSFVLTEITETEFERILELGELVTYTEFNEKLDASLDDVSVDRGGLYFPDEEWNRIQRRVVQALAAGNHVLLFGPPGTGKTKLARRICEQAVGDDQFELVTASADWSTFDTVGGYQTTADNELAFQPGVVLDRFHADKQGTPANEWLIIDELNRADIDKAFGSLFSALTGESVTLPFDGSDGEPIEILDASRKDEYVTPNSFFIPEDWRMLATMNTLDKTSLYEMSYAFMRRWAFIPVGIPEFPTDEDDDSTELAELVKQYVAAWNNGKTPESEEVYETIGRVWRTVNEARAIGPAIVEDIYEYVAATPEGDTPDYASPLIMYVFPQLEGLRRDELEQVLRDLEEIIDDTDELWTVARDFFQVDIRSDGE